MGGGFQTIEMKLLYHIFTIAAALSERAGHGSHQEIKILSEHHLRRIETLSEKVVQLQQRLLQTIEDVNDVVDIFNANDDVL